MIVFLSLFFLTCKRTRYAEIADVSKIQRVNVENPIREGIEIPVTITVKGELDKRAYLYLEGRPAKIRPRHINDMLIFGGGKINQVFKDQVGPANLTFVYVPIKAKEGHLTIEVTYNE